MKRVLMIAFHFPPVKGSSGVQRTLRFVRYLREFDWEPIVLTVDPRVVSSSSDEQLQDIPHGTVVHRTRAWDAARDFSIGGRYPGFTARPDRWVSWWLSAVPAGLAMVRRYRPQALWSTFPIATAHCVGGSLARLTGVPWIADFRDPMAQDGYPTDPAQWRSYDRVERASVSRARLCTFTTPGAVDEYRRRYPPRAEHIRLLENGYDEETFADARGGEPLNPGVLTLLHSGIVYPEERDPTMLFAALHELKRGARSRFERLRVRFRAPVHAGLVESLAQKYDVAEAIEILPAVGYREALAEMMRADGLLVLQAANCNAQIPAKLYEYLRARRPILALTDPAGDTARTVRAAGMDAIAPLDDARAIAALLTRYIDAPALGALPDEAAILGASRRGRTQQLAGLLDDATGGT